MPSLCGDNDHCYQKKEGKGQQNKSQLLRREVRSPIWSNTGQKTVYTQAKMRLLRVCLGTLIIV